MSHHRTLTAALLAMIFSGATLVATPSAAADRLARSGSTTDDSKTTAELDPKLLTGEIDASGLTSGSSGSYAIPDRVLFDGADAAEAWLGSQGSAGTGPALVSGDAPASADPTPWALDSLFGAIVQTYAGQTPSVEPTESSDAQLFQSPESTSGSGGIGLEYSANDPTTTPLRYVAADGLPLRVQPASTAASVATLSAGERVFVQPDLPVIDPANTVPFVRVETIDASPSVSGWIPLYWLYRTAADPTPGELEVVTGYPFLAKRLAEMVEAAFYADCDGSPLHPHSQFGGTPVYTGDIVPAGNQCGEYPLGDPIIPGHRHVLSLPLSFAEFDDDSLEVFLNFDQQHRDEGGYAVRDLAENFFGAGNTVSNVRHYSRFPQHESDERVRIHDTDVWFNVSAVPPQGVVPTGAPAYFNLCIELPGGVLEPDPYRLDYMTATGDYLQSIDLGALAFRPFQVCATAAIDHSVGLGDLASNPGSPQPLSIEWIHAAIRNIELEIVEGVSVSSPGGTTAGWDYGLESVFTFLLHGGAQATPWVFEQFLAGPVEQMLVDVLNAVTQPVVSSLPDPEAALANACDQLLGAYATPSSPYYPVYLHCQEMTQNASIDVLPGGLDPEDACHREDVFARVNDGRPWGSASHDETDFVTSEGQVVSIDRPMWASECGVGAEVETIARDPFWPVIDCLEGTLGEALRYDRLATLRSDSQEACLLPTVGFLCEVYGDGEDLQALWGAGASLPAVDDYVGFCQWYEVLLEEDAPSGGPAYAIDG